MKRYDYDIHGDAYVTFYGDWVRAEDAAKLEERIAALTLELKSAHECLVIRAEQVKHLLENK